MKKLSFILIAILILSSCAGKPIPTTPEVSLVEQGNKFLETRQYSSAMQVFQQELAKDPKSIEALRGIGLTYAFQGLYVEAIETYQKCLAINPQDFPSLLALGQAYNLSGRYNEAIPILQKAAGIEPKDTVLNLELANSYGNVGDYRTAIMYYNTVLEKDPSNAQVYYNMGVMQALMKNYPLAVQHLKMARQLQPDMASQVDPTIAQLEAAMYGGSR